MYHVRLISIMYTYFVAVELEMLCLAVDFDFHIFISRLQQMVTVPIEYKNRSDELILPVQQHMRSEFIPGGIIR